MMNSTPVKTYPKEKLLELLKVVVEHSMAGPQFRKSGIALLQNQLEQTNEMRMHRMRHTSNRDVEEWINIMSRTIDSLEGELMDREDQAQPQEDEIHATAVS